MKNSVNTDMGDTRRASLLDLIRGRSSKEKEKQKDVNAGAGSGLER